MVLESVIVIISRLEIFFLEIKTLQIRDPSKGVSLFNMFLLPKIVYVGFYKQLEVSGKGEWLQLQY